MPTQLRRYSPEEYLQLEEQAAYKSEYRDGEIVPMTGGTTNHNELAGNFYTFLKLALRGQAYKVYIGDVRLWIPRYRQYTYPDVVLIQGQPIYDGKGTSTVTNPYLIAEVLSKSTQNYDQGDKFTYYRSIPEFSEYILIDQAQYRVMHYVKTDTNTWRLTEIEGEASLLHFSTLPLESPLQLTLAELYAGVDFANTEVE
jgi:Uma2 family endonuclease